jgi:hypothetical protein
VDGFGLGFDDFGPPLPAHHRKTYAQNRVSGQNAKRHRADRRTRQHR